MVARISPDIEQHAKPIDFAVEDPDNAMTHPEDNLAAIRASLEAHGQVKPVVYWRDSTGSARIIAGNGTFRTAKQLGWSKLAMTEYVGTRDDAVSYALADNHTAELARWDVTKRDLQLSELGLRWEPVKVDWKPVEAKFEAPTIKIMPPAPEPKTREPRTRQEKPERALGDLWHLGKHLVMCAPSLDGHSLSVLMRGERAPLRYVTVTPDRKPRWWFYRSLESSWPSYWLGWEPMRQALDGEREKAHWTLEDVCRITRDSNAARWFVAGDTWEPIPREAYNALAEAAEGVATNITAQHTDVRSCGRAWIFRHPYEALLAVVDRLQVIQDHDFEYLAPLFTAVDGPILVLGSVLPAALVAAEHAGKACYGTLPTAESCEQAITFWETQTGRTAEKA